LFGGVGNGEDVGPIFTYQSLTIVLIVLELELLHFLILFLLQEIVESLDRDVSNEFISAIKSFTSFFENNSNSLSTFEFLL
jgi:hypothetical protein